MTVTTNVSEKPYIDHENNNILGNKILYEEKMRVGRCRWCLNLSHLRKRYIFIYMCTRLG